MLFVINNPTTSFENEYSRLKNNKFKISYKETTMISYLYFTNKKTEQKLLKIFFLIANGKDMLSCKVHTVLSALVSIHLVNVGEVGRNIKIRHLNPAAIL